MWKAAGAFLKNTYYDLRQNDKRDRYAILLQVLEYLETTAIGKELELGLNERLVGNLWALAQIEKQLPSRTETLTLQNKGNMPTMHQAQRFMRYSTAVYGPAMIAAVQQANTGKVTIDETSDSVEECLVQHVGGGLEVQHVLVADTNHGDSLECLRHTVTIDHAEKAVVLAIRGTLSLSSVYIDIAGFADDFCGGKAHAGMAAMARAVWNKGEAAVKEKLESFPKGYSLTLVGHSLGAGVACLISILLHHDKELLPPGIPVKCMAFAPPPVFHPLDAAREAVQNTFAYVHEYDVVPSLSCNALRRLMMAVVVYDQQDFTTTERIRIEYGYDKPPSTTVEEVQKVSQMTLPEVDGAPWLCIPAKCIVWLHKTEKESVITVDNNGNREVGEEIPNSNDDASPTVTKNKPHYSTLLLDPVMYAHRLIDLTPDMIADHYTNEYEAAFSAIISSEREMVETHECRR